MNWKSLKDEKPIPNTRIIIYTDNEDLTVRYRIIRSNDITRCIDATHFCYLSKPNDK